MWTYVGRISGAILLQDYEVIMEEAGFKGGSVSGEATMSSVIKLYVADILFTDRPAVLSVPTSSPFNHTAVRSHSGSVLL